MGCNTFHLNRIKISRSVYYTIVLLHYRIIAWLLRHALLSIIRPRCITSLLLRDYYYNYAMSIIIRCIIKLLLLIIIIIIINIIQHKCDGIIMNIDYYYYYYYYYIIRLLITHYIIIITSFLFGLITSHSY